MAKIQAKQKQQLQKKIFEEAKQREEIRKIEILESVNRAEARQKVIEEEKVRSIERKKKEAAQKEIFLKGILEQQKQLEKDKVQHLIEQRNSKERHLQTVY